MEYEKYGREKKAAGKDWEWDNLPDEEKEFYEAIMNIFGISISELFTSGIK